jgi:hypothetical protein
MNGHGALVVRYENPALACGKFKNFVIRQSLEAGIVGALEINGRLAAPNALNYRVIQIGIREKSDAHYFDFRNSCLARSSRFQSSGLASLSGIVDS